MNAGPGQSPKRAVAFGKAALVVPGSAEENEQWVVRRSNLDGSQVVTACGELDLSAEATLRRELLAAFADTDRPVTIDLSDVTFMDCSALGVLVSMSRRAHAQHNWIVLVSPNALVQRLLRLTGTTDLFGSPNTPPRGFFDAV
ncbi:MAG: STAS domain-containing protein [Propionibacteriales bacterium]|nr:STAS domain-containing protein [Propionibacteriales bacterium]